MGGGGVVAVGGLSGGFTVECNMGDGVAMGDTVDGEVMGADGCAPISACRCSWGGAARTALGCASLRVSSAPELHMPYLAARANADRAACLIWQPV